MKLKTKFQDEDFELGEVADVDITTMPDGCFKANAKAMRGGLHTFYYDTKADFDADWQDAPEEPKEYWYIDCDGHVFESLKLNPLSQVDLDRINIGNFFESKEEAEKAVEKFKAFKRLKANGFKFTEWGVGFDKTLVIKAKYSRGQIYDDMNLLFRGGE